MDLNFLQGLKEFLSERPITAVLALSLTANVVMFRIILKLHEARFQVAIALLPIADRMQRMVEAAANKARQKHNSSSGDV